MNFRRCRTSLLAAATVASAIVFVAAPAQASHVCGTVGTGWTAGVATTGTVSPATPNEWRSNHPSPGSHRVTLAPLDGYVLLDVRNGSCGALCSAYATPTAPATCDLTLTSPYPLVFVGVSYLGGSVTSDVNYAVTFVPTSLPELPGAGTECSDGADNDFDGATDYPNDGDCSSAADTTESPSPCPFLVAANVCASYATGSVYATYPVDWSPGTTMHAEAYVDRYQFVLPNGGTTTLPCVVLAVDSTSANACAQAGGTFVTRTATLLDNTVTEPNGSTPTTLTTLRICNANLVLTVEGAGISSFPGYTVC